MEQFKLSYKEISELLIDSKKDLDVVVGVISTNNPNMSTDIIEEFENFLVKTFVPRFDLKWKIFNSNMQRYLNVNEDWLSSIYTVGTNTENEEESSTSRGKRGRPTKSFDLSNERSKRSKVQELCNNTSAELISSAAKKLDKCEKSLKMFSPQKALSLIIDADLSKHQYEVLRRACKEIGCDIFPIYQHVLDAKKECYPANIEVDEKFSMVNLQSLLDHTVTRIVMAQSESELANFPNDLMLMSKWGCDFWAQRIQSIILY